MSRHERKRRLQLNSKFTQSTVYIFIEKIEVFSTLVNFWSTSGIISFDCFTRSWKFIVQGNYVIAYLARHPKAGDLMQSTGGIRKLRWGRGSQGKSGGVKVIYYFHNEQMPLYLLTLFGKNEQENLSHAERNELAQLTTLLVRTWKSQEKQ